MGITLQLKRQGLLLPVVLLMMVILQLTTMSVHASVPALPTSYSVIVALNSNDLGFTYAYKEFYDTTSQLWRFDMNYGADQQTNVLSYNQVLCTHV